MEPNQERTNPTIKVEFFDPAPLRVHPLHKGMPTIQTDNIEWHAFVDALSAAGPEGIPAIYITAEGLIIDGERRWKAAKQLQWPLIACVTKPEWEAATLIVESLLGQRSLTKGAKVYLSLPLLEEYRKSSEDRRLACLRKGNKTLQKPLISPLAHSAGSRKSSEALAERLGVGKCLVEYAVQIRKYFEMPSLVGHKFEFQDGSEMTLKEYFEPRILSPEDPMGLGEVLKGIGWFVTPEGKPLNHPPPARNSHLFYFQHGWSTWSKHCERWIDMSSAERDQASEAIAKALRGVPQEVLSVTARFIKAEGKRRNKTEKRKGLTAGHREPVETAGGK